jgi:hypothetical protein
MRVCVIELQVVLRLVIRVADTTIDKIRAGCDVSESLHLSGAQQIGNFDKHGSSEG